jgi:hypothetical protein
MPRQAFALSQFEADGGGSFLTSRLPVRGLAEAIQPLLTQLDGPALRWLVAGEAPRLRAVWLEAEANLEAAVNRSATSNVAHRASEAELAEPLLTYTAHGALQAGLALPLASSKGGRLSETRLLLGSRISLLGSTEGCTSALAGADGGCDREPRHLILEAAEPSGPLYACRSLFLGSAVRAPPRAPSVSDSLVTEELSDGAAPAPPATSPLRRGPARGVRMATAGRFAPNGGQDADDKNEEVAQMHFVYSALCSLLLHALALAFADASEPRATAKEGTRAAGELAAHALGGSGAASALARLRGMLSPHPAGAAPPSLSHMQAQAASALQQALVLRCGEAGLPPPSDQTLSSLSLVLEAVDLHGAPAALADAAALVSDGRCLLRARASIELVTGGGALAVGETVAADGLGGMLVLSDALPRYAAFRAAGAEAEASAELLSPCVRMAEAFDRSAAASAAGVHIASALADGGAHPLLGKLLCAPLDGCALLLPGCTMLPPLTGTLFALEYGLLLKHPRLGCLLVRFDSTAAAPTSAALLDTAGGAGGQPSTDALTGDAAVRLATAGEDASGVVACHASRHDLDVSVGGDAPSSPLLLAFGWDASARTSAGARPPPSPGAVAAAASPRLPFTGEGGGLAAVIGAAAAVPAATRNGASSDQPEHLVLAVGGSAARHAFLRQVLPAWKARWEGSVTRYHADGAASIPDAAAADAVAQHDLRVARQAVAALRLHQAPWPQPNQLAAAAARARGDARQIATLAGGSVPPPLPTRPGPPLLLSCVAGLPGSGVHEAADALVAATAGPWLRATVATAAEVPVAIARAVAGPCPTDKPRLLLLSVCGWAPIPDVLAAAVAVPGVRVCGAAAVVHAARALERCGEPGSARCAAGMLEQAAAGFCQAILLAHCADVSQVRMGVVFARPEEEEGVELTAPVLLPRPPSPALASSACLLLLHTGANGASRTHPPDASAVQLLKHPLHAVAILTHSHLPAPPLAGCRPRPLPPPLRRQPPRLHRARAQRPRHRRRRRPRPGARPRQDSHRRWPHPL